MNTIINNVDVYPSYTDSNGNTEERVIYRVNWMNIIKDELGNSTSLDGHTILKTDDISNITEFSLLTKEQVKEWVINDWGGRDSEGFKEKVKEVKSVLDEHLSPSSINMTLQG